MTSVPLSSTGLWGDRPFPPDGETDRVRVGPLTLWYKVVDNEVWLAHRHETDASGVIPAGPPPDVEWSRWAMRDHVHHLHIAPVFPEEILVVRPEHSFTLLRRARARVYMRVPIWVRVEAVEGSDARFMPATLVELPTATLSHTWWGDFRDGEMGYGLTTRARRELSPELFEPHLAVSTLQLVNRSQDNLAVEKIAVRSAHLSLYQRGGELWTEEMQVEYRGEAEGSDVLMLGRAPDEAEGSVLLTPPRRPTKGLHARTFARLKALSGFGL
ncbi:MAG: hypothetical protein OEZ65_00420 [Gemmatimonadota bacterium]|nr:hypothetical protein [Gemmatimonadota bacterium]MDH5758017.1 hypothetical protein [Gemmatimonadota bacterium]